ncbi:hypothetical protein BRD04_04590 [Halobacteriales archaeon QS_9_67_17]|nr:MAG: hypothetical protein BRD04_04590 [Halobacteriales archaeon QS_9_67_17]
MLRGRRPRRVCRTECRHHARVLRCRCRCDRLGVAGQVVTADTLRGVDGRFDTVLCNPPTHAGDGVLSSLFGRVDDLLADDGHVFVVHHAGVDIDAALRRVGTPTVVGKKDEHVVVRVE